METCHNHYVAIINLIISFCINLRYAQNHRCTQKLSFTVLTLHTSLLSHPTQLLLPSHLTNRDAFSSLFVVRHFALPEPDLPVYAITWLHVYFLSILGQLHTQVGVVVSQRVVLKMENCVCRLL